MVVAIIFVFLMLSMQFNTVSSSEKGVSVNSKTVNQSSQSNSNTQSFLSYSNGLPFYNMNLISSFSVPTNLALTYPYGLNVSLYIPMNHDMVVMGTVPFLDPNIFPCNTGDATWNDTIVVLTPQGYEKNIVTFNTVGPHFITSSRNALNFFIPCPYISSAAFDQFNKNIYISVPLFSNVSIFNFTTCNITGSIPVGKDPVNISVDQLTGYIYVINRDSNNVSVINPYTEKVVASINVGISPDAAIFDPYNRYLYVVNSGSDSISVINTTNDFVTATINVGSDPTDMIFDPQNHIIYVNNEKSDCISVIESQYNSVEKIINIPEPLTNTNKNMVYCEKTGSIYAGGDTSNITVINTTKNIITDKITTETPPFYHCIYNLTLDPYNNSLMTSQVYGGNVVVNLTTNSREGFLWVQSMRNDLFINNPFSNREYLINSITNDISVYTFNITNTYIVTPLNLYPLIFFVSIVLLAVVIIWRIKVRNSQYKDYIA